MLQPWSLCSACMSVKSDFHAFVWQRGERWNRKRGRCRWGWGWWKAGWQVRLHLLSSGYAMMAMFPLYRHERASAHAYVWKKKSDWSLIQALKVPRIFVPAPRLQPAITEVCADQTDNQSGAQSMHKISTERQR